MDHPDTAPESSDDIDPRDAAKIVRAEAVDALSRARAGVGEARNTAEQIVAEARRDAERIRAEALEQGRREAAALTHEYAERIRRDLDGLEARMIDIAAASLRKALDPVPPERLVAAGVRRAMADVDLGRGATLLVSPKLAPALKESLEAIGVGPERVEVLGDPGCPEESSVLRTPYGDLELGVEAQLQALEEGLRTARAADSRDEGGA